MKLKIIALSSAVAILFSGCALTQGTLVKDNSNDRAKTGSLIGALTGAFIGAGTSKNNKVKGALIGGLAGAAVGGGVGYLLDQQANEVANALGTGVSNDPLAALDPNKTIVVSKGQDYVKIMFRDSMMFPFNSSQLQPSAKNKVLKVAQLLSKYPQMTAQIAGFTDDKGSFQYNQKLSLSRAQSVANLLKSQGLRNKIYVKGCSYNKPLVPNKTDAQRALNRRVEIYLYNDPSKAVNPCM